MKPKHQVPMPNIDPLPRAASPEFEDVFQAMENALGYVPNSFFTMARHPSILKCAGALMDAFWYSYTVDEPTRRLVTFGYSHFAGSHYSSAHCACGAVEMGLPEAKILEINAFETSSAYTKADRILLHLCKHAAQTPSGVTPAVMDEVKTQFGVDVTTFIVGLISCMSFLNKWNEMCGTTLEDIPLAYARENLEAVGWKLDQ